VPRRHELLLYDGHCGLCHRWVRRVARHDARADRFRFAPLEGETARRALAPAQRAALPDSIVVRTRSGELLTQAGAVRHLVDRLGRPPGLFLMTLPMRLPCPIADAVYRGVARIRFAVFGRTADACPLVPPHLRERFLP